MSAEVMLSTRASRCRLDDDAPLSPLSFALAARHRDTRQGLRKRLAERAPEVARHTPLNLLGETPLVLSSALAERLQARADLVLRALLAGQLHSHDSDNRQLDAVWPHLPAADVICIDLAVVHSADPNGPGWDVAIVEFQTFASIASFIAELDETCRDLWPELQAFRPWARPFADDWNAAARAWLAPGHNNVLIEHQPWQQFTAFDFAAQAHRLGVQIADAQDLIRSGDKLFFNGQRVDHLNNRVILHELPDRAAFERRYARADVHWHAHPSHYYRVNKGGLPKLALPAPLRCLRADQASTTPRPLSDYVLKAAHSYGGQHVNLRPTPSDLAALPDPQNWILQPRYQPFPLLQASDGAPLFGEIRLQYALGHGASGLNGAPWRMASSARMSRGNMASARKQDLLPGNGTAVVYWPD